ncbi:MAG: hypothetical protein INF79_11085 [Roseomonas sp.]|nr:hypothetical protein [Roseomonas sp.]
MSFVNLRVEALEFSCKLVGVVEMSLSITRWPGQGFANNIVRNNLARRRGSSASSYLFVNGTGADRNSDEENVNRFHKDLSQEGYKSTVFDGLGSRLYSKRTGIDRFSGLVLGSGYPGLVAQIAEFLVEEGKSTDEITVGAFSRGAVASIDALAQVAQELQKLGVKVRLLALDPVPGETFVPKKLVVPSVVKKFKLFVSREEGRPGFERLNVVIENPRETEYSLDMVAGVHGHIGGSKSDGIADLVRDKCAEFLGGPLQQMPPLERNRLIFKEFSTPTSTRWHGIEQYITARTFFWDGPTRNYGPLQFPLWSSYQDLRARLDPFLTFMEKPRGDAEFRARTRELETVFGQEPVWGFLKLIEEQAPSIEVPGYMGLNAKNEVTFWPPTIRETDKKMSNVIGKILKKP